MSYSEDARKLLLEFLSRLDKKEKAEMFLLANKWGVVYNSLEGLIDKLSKEENLSKDKLFRLDLYKQFLGESKAQIKNYTVDAAQVIKENQLYFAETGIASTQGIISLVTVNFNRLPISAVNKMIGLTSDGSKLYDLLKLSYPETVTKLTNTLIESISLGRNPLVTARLMQESMNGNLTRAITIARTEQMRVFRESSILQMVESEVVSEWEWSSEPDACDFCLENDGKRFPLTTPMNTHPNCRCGELPIIGGI